MCSDGWEFVAIRTKTLLNIHEVKNKLEEEWILAEGECLTHNRGNSEFRKKMCELSTSLTLQQDLFDFVKAIDCQSNEEMDYVPGESGLNQIKYILLAKFPDTHSGKYWKDFYMNVASSMTKSYIKPIKRDKTKR